MKRVCMEFDIYYSDPLFDSSDNGKPTTLGNYMKRLNMIQYTGKTFDNSIKEGFVFDSRDVAQKAASEAAKERRIEKEREEPVDPEFTKRWGNGFTKTDYDILNSHYKLLKDSNPQCDNNQEIFINDLCYTKMQQMKAVREGRVDDYNKLTESYRKSFQQAGLKTVKDSNTNDEFSFGITVETIEKYTPAEYYKNKKLYKDFDGIGDYINRFMLRPLRNLMHGTQDRDYEFYVKDEDEAGGFEEDE